MRKAKWDTVLGRQMWEEGKKDAEIADAFGIPTGTVTSYRLKHWDQTNVPQKKPFTLEGMQPVAESAPLEHTCVRCGRGTNNTEMIGEVAIHICDACKERISLEVKWERQGETWRKPNVICPYCGYELDSEDSALFFEVGETKEYACEWCQRKFDVEVREVRYYSTNRSVCEMPEDWQPPEETAHGSV